MEKNSKIEFGMMNSNQFHNLFGLQWPPDEHGGHSSASTMLHQSQGLPQGIQMKREPHMDVQPGMQNPMGMDITSGSVADSTSPPPGSSGGMFDSSISDMFMDKKAANSIRATLESSSPIILAHVNPQCYSPVPLDSNDGQPRAVPPGATTLNENGAQTSSSMWFIGLKIEKFEKTNLNIDLTQEVLTFSTSVTYNAKSANMLRKGMTLDAHYVRRKDLHRYIPESLLKGKCTTGHKRTLVDRATDKPVPPKRIKA